MVDVAIVMVTHNTLHPECLSSVRHALQGSSLKTAFVLVDNASTAFDAVAEVKRHVPRGRIICRDMNAGFGASSNRGAREYEADAYFFLNPDTVLEDARVLNELFAFLKAHPKVGAVAPRVEYLDGRLQHTCRRFPKWYMPFVRRTVVGEKDFGRRYGAEFLMEDFDHAFARPVDWAQGSALLVDGALFRMLGGFDERYFMYFEDVDLCRSIWDAGRAVYYHPSVSLRHAYGQGSAKTKGVLRSVFQNRLARAHLASWAKYHFKWFSRAL